MTAALPLFSDAPFQARPLRDHQRRAIDQVRAALRSGKKRVVLQMPTGAGKTRTAAEIIMGALRRGNSAAFTVPAISLINQTVDAFEDEGIFSIGVMQATHPRTDMTQPVQIASVQTLARRDTLPEGKIVLVDECHLQHQVVLDWMASEPDTVFIGLTATPWAKGMAGHWQGLVVPTSIAELTALGYLSPFKVFAPSHPDLSAVRIKGGDYREDQLSTVMSEGALVADVVETWLRLSDGRPTLVFAVDLAHARKLQEQFRRGGVRMGYCDAYTDLIERRVLFDQVARGELAGIVNVGTLTTGVDADIRCIVMARPTRSEILFAQCIGRGLRPAEGKDYCLILDHSDNHARLGFVTDIHHPELLTKGAKVETRQEQGKPMPKECPKCGALKPPGRCPHCGFLPERQSEIEHSEGELVEVRGKKSKEATPEERQRFWSMALWLCDDRGKQESYGKALYHAKFGSWPSGLSNSRLKPDPGFLNYDRSRRIGWAKSKRRGQ